MDDLVAHFSLRRDSGFTVDAVIDVVAGNTTALLGPNGAGKSTVVSAIAGLDAIDSGIIKLGDRVLDDPGSDIFVEPSDRRVGVVFQNALLFPHMSVAHNIEFGLKSLKREPERSSAVLDAWTERLDLRPLLDRRTRELSGGEIQRVAIARTMVTEPDLLILDEPLAAIDASARPAIRRLLSDFLVEFEGPAIVITHDPAEAFLLADEVVIIEDGHITQSGSPDDIRLQPATSYAADLAGVNLVVGVASDGKVVVGGHTLQIADSHLTGEVVATIHPRAISLHRNRPEGSQRNVWLTRVKRLERQGDTVRIATGSPLELIAEVTTDGARATGLALDAEVWVAVKATEIQVRSADETGLNGQD